MLLLLFMSRRNLYLRGSFTESNGRNVNPGNIIHNRNPKRPARTINPNDFDKYIDILKVNNRYPIPKELTLPIYTTPYTLDKDIYLAKDSVINFFGTAPAYLNKFSISSNNTVYDISTKFTYTETGTTFVTQNTDTDWTIIYIEYLENFYRITYIVHRVAGEITISIPANSYYYQYIGNYNSEEIPALTFYEGDQPILYLNSVSTPTDDGNGRIVTSSLITQFVFTSN